MSSAASAGKYDLTLDELAWELEHVAFNHLHIQPL